ncbi:outer membrane lipoprotein-sorting protein [Paracoccaceae bacterium]|nr:outer membrane lipoprotein-sorting protein [Paracoccaceae bacterium]
MNGNMIFQKNLLIFVFLMLPNISIAMNAYEIMKKVDQRYTGETIEQTSTLVLIDKKKRKRERKLKGFSKEVSEGTKSISFFLSPSDVKNTSYLSYNWDDPKKEDDSWLYLPSLQKTNRIAGGDRSNSFMGSDFTYSDLDGVEIEDYDFKIVKDSDTVDGADCWVIEATPKSNDVIKETGYLKTLTWIRKDIFFGVKGRILVKKGKKVKLWSAKDLKKIDGVWVAKTQQMTTTKKKKREHSSVFIIDKISFNKKLDESMFDAEAMQRGY